MTDDRHGRDAALANLRTFCQTHHIGESLLSGIVKSLIQEVEDGRGAEVAIERGRVSNAQGIEAQLAFILDTYGDAFEAIAALHGNRGAPPPE
jgi:hypothetical protein